MASNPLHLKRWSKVAWVAVAMATLVVIGNCISLARRAGRGESDIGVFLRSARLLNEGAGPEFYAGRDASTGWYRTIPPVGLCLFQPLAGMDRAAGGSLWALLNLGFLATAIFAIAKCLGRAEDPGGHVAGAFPWVVCVLLILASASIQVGQFSLLFVACWLVSLAALLRGRPFCAGVGLALPSAIKLYPALMLAFPMVGPARQGVRVIAGFVLGAILFVATLPLVALGPRAHGLTMAFVRHAILGDDGRVAGYGLINADTVSSEGLDAVVMRYLTHGPGFHSIYPGVPHFRLDHQVALRLAHLLRAAILLATIVATLRLRCRSDRRPRDTLIQSAALWSAAMYVMLPETKARYAVYTILAFIPLVLLASRAKMEANRAALVGWSAAIVFCLAMVLQVHPPSLRAFGLGYLGPLLLWGLNVSQSMARQPSADEARPPSPGAG